MIKALFAFSLALLPFFQSSAQETIWPQKVASDAGEVTVYQPQVDSYNGNQLTAHAAVSVLPTAEGTPIFGAIFFTASIATDRDTDTVSVQSIAVTNSRFPTADADTAASVSQALDTAAPQWNLTFSLRQLLAQIALTQEQETESADLNNTPPQILFESTPSVLVTISGEPHLRETSEKTIMTVVNTPFFIALDMAEEIYYLRAGSEWLSSPDLLTGPWTPASDVPEAVNTLASKLPETSSSDTDDANTSDEPPKVIVATQPTELIQTTGPAEYGPIEGTELLYVTNTDSNVFMAIDSQALYVLLAGRWFTAASQAGPWTFVAGDQLPADFSKIPPGSAKSAVLASVPGTATAKDAVLNAKVPQTAAIQRSAPAPDVTYYGEPSFEKIKGASDEVQMASNTPQDVLQVGENYYVCSDGVWFQSEEAVGPWVVSVEVPDVIYSIPPTCPLYPVTYCRIYGFTDDVVYCGYLPGYAGSYVYGGGLVYGTGWPYNIWVGNTFIPSPVTWGFGASFSMGWNCWGFSIGTGWGGPDWFNCGWNSNWWGCGNYHWNNWNWNSTWNQDVNINRNVTNTINRTVNNTNIYRNHPDRLTPNERQRLKDNEDHLAKNQERLQNQIDRDRGNPNDRAQRQSDRKQEERDEDREQHDQNRLNRGRNDVYADRDGNVYRHNGDAWQHRDGDEWKDAHENEAFHQHRNDLNRHFVARSRGNFGGHHFGGGHRGGGGGGGRRR